jgi:hypothetical protein
MGQALVGIYDDYAYDVPGTAESTSHSPVHRAYHKVSVVLAHFHDAHIFTTYSRKASTPRSH